MGGHSQFSNQMGQNPQQGMYEYMNQTSCGMPYGGSGLYVNQYPYNETTQNLFTPTKLPFLATLELPDL